LDRERYTSEIKIEENSQEEIQIIEEIAKTLDKK